MKEKALPLSARVSSEAGPTRLANAHEKQRPCIFVQNNVTIHLGERLMYLLLGFPCSHKGIQIRLTGKGQIYEIIRDPESMGGGEGQKQQQKKRGQECCGAKGCDVTWFPGLCC